jgi:hypothetical protein
LPAAPTRQSERSDDPNASLNQPMRTDTDSKLSSDSTGHARGLLSLQRCRQRASHTSKVHEPFAQSENRTRYFRPIQDQSTALRPILFRDEHILSQSNSVNIGSTSTQINSHLLEQHTPPPLHDASQMLEVWQSTRLHTQHLLSVWCSRTSTAWTPQKTRSRSFHCPPTCPPGSTTARPSPRAPTPCTHG